MLRTVAVLFAIVFCLIFMAAPVLLYTLVTGDDETLYRVGRLAVKMVLRAGGVHIRAEGRERVDPRGTYVFMSNHVSNADPLAVVLAVPRVAALAKHSVFRIPFLGAAMKWTGFIPVVRGTTQAASTVEAGSQTLRNGRSLMVFPEGTRSTTGEMLPFRRGVFVMAIRAQVPVVPMTLIGSRNVMRKRDLRIYPGTIRVVIHDPIPTAGLTEHDRHTLAERVKAVIGSALAGEAEAISPRSRGER